MIDEILRREPAKRFALRLIKKHLPVPERRVHSSSMQHRLVQRYLWRRIGGNVDAFSFCRDDHGIDRRFSVARDLRVPHTVQLHGEASDGKALRRELAPVRNIQCSARMILRKRLRRFFVIMVRVQVCEQKPAGLFVCAGSRYNFLPDRFRRAVKRRKLLRQCINQKTRFPGREDKSAVTDQSYLHCSMSRNSCSERTGMPSSFAFLSLLPAFSPATT